MTITWLQIYFLCACLFGAIAFLVYWHIKPMKEPARSRNIMVYSSILLANIILFICLRLWL